MSRRILFFQSKVALAIIGTVLIGSVAALIAGASFSATPNRSSTNQSHNYVNIASSGDTPSSDPTSGKSPTATPTPTRGSQVTSLRGTVTGVDTANNLFTVRSGGVTKTVTVTSQTTFTGACTSLRDMGTGWQVRVQGAYQNNGSFAASSVYSSQGD